MRRLMLLRHAKADRPHDVNDHDRPLAKAGQTQSQTIGTYMAGQELIPDLVIVSTARRAQETWRYLLPAFTAEITQRSDARLYEASAQEILQIVKETAPSIHVLLLVGHNPGFEQLASNLAGTAHPAASSLMRPGCPPAGLAIIDFAVNAWTDVSAGGGYLERFETPESVNAESF